MYLLDTNVVSEARRGTPQAVAWLRSVDPLTVHLSALTLGEAGARLATAGFIDLESFASAPTSATGLLAARAGGEP